MYSPLVSTSSLLVDAAPSRVTSVTARASAPEIPLELYPARFTPATAAASAARSVVGLSTTCQVLLNTINPTSTLPGSALTYACSARRSSANCVAAGEMLLSSRITTILGGTAAAAAGAGAAATTAASAVRASATEARTAVLIIGQSSSGRCRRPT